MRLYTIQPRFVYDTLCETGIFMSEPWKDSENWICNESPAIKLAYDWLRDVMMERGLLRPATDAYPVWAWYQYTGEQKRKPDLRRSDMKSYARNGRHVLFTLDIPAEDVLLHDFEAWHYPLNYLHLAAQQVSNRFERQCKIAGHPLYNDVPLKDLSLHDEVQRTWHTIFDLPACRHLFKRSRAEQSVQATFWTLSASHVSAAVEFGGGQRRRALPLPEVRHGAYRYRLATASRG